MTREEAIDILRSYLMFDKSNMQIDMALNMAIEALSADAVHIETYRELYEKYVNLKHASGESTKPEVIITDTDIMYVGENYKA